MGDAPWPPHYAKAPGEPPRVMPSRARKTSGVGATSSDEAGGGAVDRAATGAALSSAAPSGTASSGKPGRSPTGRRVSTKPLIEIARAATRDEALTGFERWKQRHSAVAGYLDPLDVLVDGMRGRYKLWYRIRVNLEHVPLAERPQQEPLEVDYDPWGEFR
jgi:hypothetical protein